MSSIRRICLEDGPEDGRVLTRAMLDVLCGAVGRISDDISLYADDDSSRAGATPVLLGRYRLGCVVDGTATYRWRSGR
jgi:hypothetical protein